MRKKTLSGKNIQNEVTYIIIFLVLLLLENLNFKFSGLKNLRLTTYILFIIRLRLRLAAELAVCDFMHAKNIFFSILFYL